MLAGLSVHMATPRWPAPPTPGAPARRCAVSSSVTGCWASQSTCTSGRCRRSSATIARSRRTVPETDRRAEVEHPARPVERAGPAPGRGRGRGRRHRPDHVPDQPVDHDRLAGRREVARARERDQRAAGQLGDTGAPAQRLAPVRLTVHGDHRASDPGEQRLRVLLRRLRVAGVAQDHRLRRRLQRPADRVLPLLGRVRLGQQLVEEELDEAAASRAASSAGFTSPIPRRCPARPPESARSAPATVA